MLKQRLEEKTIDAYLDVQAIQGDVTSAHDSIRDTLSAYLVSTRAFSMGALLTSRCTGNLGVSDRECAEVGENWWCALLLSIQPVETSDLCSLEKLRQLPIARAAFDQSPKAHCLSGTRVDIIKQLLSDLKNSPSRFVWLKGSPGRGKSAIAKSICTELRADNVPVTSFFFNKDGSQAHTSSAARFASTIARQLARISDEFGKELAKLDLEESLRTSPKKNSLSSW